VCSSDLAGATSLTTLHHFTGADGRTPNGLVVDKKGELFGTTHWGGAADKGVLFRLRPPAPGETRWKRQVLHTFRGGTDGARPTGLTLAADGVIYGATLTDGPINGSIFSMSPPAVGGTAWTYRILHGFAMQKDGILPYSAPVRGAGGRLYGTTAYDVGFGQNGTVYELTPPAPGTTKWSERVIFSFGATGAVGVIPFAPPLRLADGGLLVTANTGGISRLSPPAVTLGPWRSEVVVRAPGYKGFLHFASGDGRVFGTTETGARTGDEGSVFALVPPTASGVWTIDLLHTFTGGADGSFPRRIVQVGKTLYGVTERGGAADLGTIFRLDPPASAGGSWVKKTVYTFQASGAGSYPTTLVRGPDGALYGTTGGGGAYGKGTVFRFVR
jgi:uncharacterized repeat protein (TIGR03803 family)